ncbi:MAG: alkaline phosphatase family protein [bacterium]|nr:alkaline phosphatase family protein [bacterium]
MSLFRRVLVSVLSVLLLAVLWFAYTAIAPYDLPESRLLQTGRPFQVEVPTRQNDGRRVIVFVFDGLSPATVAAADTPHLDRMAREGAHTHEMMPVFPSLSLPNHFTLSTGCYPARHGIVSNHFHDPERGFYGVKGDADWILECEPLHVVAERQGIRSAVFGWVGNTSSSRGQLASIAEPFRVPVPSPEQQADAIIAQLDADLSPGLIAAYVTEPDSTAHSDGPTGQATLEMAHQVDAQIGRVLAAIEERGLSQRVSLIVTTDHGMVDVKGMLNVDGIVREAGVKARVVGEGVMGHLYLDDPEERESARQALAGGEHYTVLDPTNPPSYARIGHHSRLGDLVIVPDEGYWLADLAHFPWFLRWASYVSGELIESERFKGMHGYDPEKVPGVRSVFYAWGAQVPPGIELQEMRSIDVHPTVTFLLGIQPGSPIDGRAHSEIARGL